MVNASLATAEAKFVGGVVFSGITASIIGIIPALISVLVLVSVDFATGIWAALHTKVKIESHKMRKTAYKLLAYLSVIVLGAMIDGSVDFQLNLGTFIAVYICLVESSSVVENFGKITGHDAFEKLKELIGKKTEKLDK